MSKIVELNPGIKPKEITPAHIAAAKKSLKNAGTFKAKARGGSVKKYARGGGVRKANYK